MIEGFKATDLPIVYSYFDWARIDSRNFQVAACCSRIVTFQPRSIVKALAGLFALLIEHFRAKTSLNLVEVDLTFFNYF